MKSLALWRHSGPQSIDRPEEDSQSSFRTGSMLHYVLVYMTLASALLTVGGVVLHTILKADTSDRRESQFLSSLLRAEKHLRSDSRDNRIKFESASQLSLVTLQQTQVNWSAERGILSRTELRDTQILATERYIFPAGSQISFKAEEPSIVVIRIVEPSAFVKYSSLSNGGTNPNKPEEEANPATPSSVAQPNVVEIRLKGANP